jgi:transposase
MALGRYVVDAVLLEGYSPTEIARTHGISRYWLYKLIARFREGGYAALEPRSRRPRSCTHAVAPEIQAAIVRLRGELADAGHDCGPHTIAHHLRLELGTAPSVATIWRILARHGLITPQPHKRPRSTPASSSSLTPTSPSRPRTWSPACPRPGRSTASPPPS